MLFMLWAVKVILASPNHRSMFRIDLVSSTPSSFWREASRVIDFDTTLYRFNNGVTSCNRLVLED